MNGEHPGQPSHPSKEKLQRHHDGELSEQEATELRQHLRTCAPCHAELESLERLSDMVRWSTDEIASVSDVNFTQMFAEIERAVSPDDAAASANVISLQKKRASPVLRAVPALAAVAIAAAAFLMLNRSDALPNNNGEEQLALLDASLHSEVTAVKFGENAGQLFDIPLPDGVNIPVVWIDDADDEGE